MRYYDTGGFRGVPYNGYSGVFDIIGGFQDMGTGIVILAAGAGVSIFGSAFGLKRGWPMTLAGLAGMGVGGYLIYEAMSKNGKGPLTEPKKKEIMRQSVEELLPEEQKARTLSFLINKYGQQGADAFSKEDMRQFLVLYETPSVYGRIPSYQRPIADAIKVDFSRRLQAGGVIEAKWEGAAGVEAWLKDLGF